ncbi:MAG: DNA alkylation repair protein [Candidatus Paceibacterota bacterium]|jgi:3-methyladenine DNA glycosylase AlkD
MPNSVKKILQKKRNKEKAIFLLRFFKTQKGQYGEGDVFWGITVPEQRKIAQQFKHISLSQIQELLNDQIHECRLTGLLILIEKYNSAEEKEQEKIFKLYLKNYQNINNWDLVDLSAPAIVGNYLLDKDRKTLYDLAKSNNLWKKRIAIVSTYAFIKNKDLEDTFKIAKILLNDSHDLIQKAVGWMLREVGKRNKEKEVEFLKKYALKMPRMMLRYSIEKFSGPEREKFLSLT